MSKWYYYWKPIENLTNQELIHIIELQHQEIQRLQTTQYDGILFWSHITKHAKKTQANQGTYKHLFGSGNRPKENSTGIITIKRW